MNELNFSIQGNVKLEDILDFLDSNNVVIHYSGLELPKISSLDIEHVNGYFRDPNVFYKHVISWVKKAKSEKSGFDKFFALWVAFNSFYNFCYERIQYEYGEECRRNRECRNRNERCQFKCSIEYLITEDEASLLLKNLKDKIQELVNQPYEIKHRNELRNNLEHENLNKNTLNLLVSVLYGIRNNLFHGGKSLNARQEKLLNVAFEILLPILSLLLIKYLICYHSHHSYNVPYELCPSRTQR